MVHKKLLKAFFTTLVCFIFTIYVLPTRSLALGPTSQPIYQGMDVSIYQGNINFEAVKADGIEVVYIKSSQGYSYIDPNFERNYTNAKANGLKVGLYHYVTARTEDEARRQAQFFVSLLSGKSIDCKLAMDFETFGDLNREQINSVGLAFLREVERLSGKQAILYSNAFTAKTIWDGENTNYPLWIAEYEVEEPENVGTWESWTGWQYTDRGEVSGIEGYVDRDYFTKEVFLDDNSAIPPVDNPNEGGDGGNGENPTPENTKRIVIRRGDTLSQLAITYNTTVATLVSLNGIANPNLIYAGDTLLVPVNGTGGGNNSGGGSGNNNGSGNNGGSISDGTLESNGTMQTYTVQRGDTLSQIALRFNTTVSAIAVQNNIRNVNLIYPGQKLVIRENLEYATNKRLYTVIREDTLWGIARRYNTTIANIVRLNRIQNPNLIFPGQIFRI